MYVLVMRLQLDGLIAMTLRSRNTYDTWSAAEAALSELPVGFAVEELEDVPGEVVVLVPFIKKGAAKKAAA